MSAAFFLLILLPKLRASRNKEGSVAYITLPSLPSLATLVTTATVCGFILLTCFAYGRADAMRPHPIALSGFDDMPTISKEVVLWKPDKHAEFHEKQAAALSAVYGITAENLNEDIFGGDQ